MPDKYILYSLPAPIRVESLINIIAIDLPATARWGESHDFWEMVYMERENGPVPDQGGEPTTVDGVPYHMHEGQLIFYPPGAFHGGGSKAVSVCIAAFSCQSPLLYDLCGGPFDLSPALASEFSALVRWGAELFECRDASSRRFIPRGAITVYDLQLLKNRLESFLLALYKDRCCRGPRSDSRLLPELVYILRANLAQNMTVEDLAQSAGISVNRVKKLFREAYGCGPIHFFLNLKIEEAQKLLASSQYNVSQVADRLGFSSIHYFSRLFKEKTGLSPKEYMTARKSGE